MDALAADLQAQPLLNGPRKDPQLHAGEGNGTVNPSTPNGVCQHDTEGSCEPWRGEGGGGENDSRATDSCTCDCGEMQGFGEGVAGCLTGQGSGGSGEGSPTDVVVHVLDWKDSVTHLRPPFGMLLVADVVKPPPPHPPLSTFYYLILVAGFLIFARRF